MLRVFDYYKYGLDFFVSDHAVSGISERAFAKFYYLDYIRQTASPFSRIALIAQAEFEAHAMRLAAFLVDYILATALAEGRHIPNHTKDTEKCLRCVPFRLHGCGKSRSEAAVNLMNQFETYKDALEAVNHIYWDHVWVKGYGGWKWGNSTWIAQELYNGMKARDIAHIIKWIDVIASIEHNGGSCLNAKFSVYIFDNTRFQQILWAKFHSEPCCIDFLKSIMHGIAVYSGCTHAKGLVRGSDQPVLRPGYKAKWLCIKCKKPRDKSKIMVVNGYCVEFCNWCLTCKCILIGKVCGTCYKEHTSHVCEGGCQICGVIVKPGTGHPKCHHCYVTFVGTPPDKNGIKICKHCWPSVKQHIEPIPLPKEEKTENDSI